MNLTIQELKDMKPETKFATGTGTYPDIHKEEIRWVACRGGIHDWCIYYGYTQMSVEEVARNGDKIHSEESIKRLVPCDEEAYGMYRR